MSITILEEFHTGATLIRRKHKKCDLFYQIVSKRNVSAALRHNTFKHMRMNKPSQAKPVEKITVS